MVFVGRRMFPISELGISQIYLNERKLSAVMEWFDPDKAEMYDPLPVHDYGNGRYTLTDGHSRAYIAYKSGLSHIPIVYDTDDIVSNETGILLYKFDIEWCDRFGLRGIANLGDRIVSDEVYRRLWEQRCDRSHNLLLHTSEDERLKIEQMTPSLFLYGANDDLTVYYFENVSGELFELTDGVVVREEQKNDR